MLSKLRNLSLTAKLAVFLVVANLAGIAILSVYNWYRETDISVAGAVEKWEADTAQFASLSAGGIKWGKSDVVQESYAHFKADETLNLVQFAAFKGDRSLVDKWQREGAENVLADEAILEIAAGEAGQTKASRALLSDNLITVTSVLPAAKDGQPAGYIVTAWTTAPLYAAANHNALVMIGIQAVVIAAAVLLFIFYVRSLIGRPLDGLSQSIRRLQDGEYDIEVPFQQRRDEIGFVARALDTFRTESIVKQEEGVAAENNRKAFEAERVQNAEQVAATAQNQTETIAVVAKALEELADGNFDTRLENLPEDFAKLANDFNRMVDAVSTTLSEIKTVSDSVGTGSNELANSADLLARRTEQTAASLEETAASLQEMTTTVKESSTRAQEAGQLVNKTKTDAATSSKVVREAVGAMDSIKASSSQIGQTISVINDIAFQTNLLALNAGVEAARAGEAGAGFAVVAYEVRELAQRCATAAKEISELIADSDREVATGVDLVRKTGDALIDIEKQVNDINDGIHAIVGAYREQSTGLEEINVAVVSMDQTTQQNAAMVEETNAACQELRSQSTKLNAAVSRFTLSGSMEQPAAEPEKPKTGPVNKNTARPRAMAVAGNTALATQPGEWEEF